MRRLFWLLALWPGLAWAQCALPPNASALASAVYEGVNAQRAAQGLSALSPVAELALAAQGHACDMAAFGIRNHTGANGSAVDARVRQTGFRTCVTSENIAWGFGSGDRVVDFWMGSPGHQRNMLSGRIQAMGVGIAQGADGPQWVLVMSRPC